MMTHFCDVFVSYAREDREHADCLIKALQQQGLSVWWDQMIGIGENFADAIEEALRAAKCIIVLWSQKSVKSNWTRIEAREGANRKILLPVLIENTNIPLEFSSIQTGDLTEWDGSSSHYSFQNLLIAIFNLLHKPQFTQQTEVLLIGWPQGPSLHMSTAKVTPFTKAQQLINALWLKGMVAGKTLDELKAGLPVPPKSLMLFDWNLLKKIDPEVTFDQLNARIFFINDESMAPFIGESKSGLLEHSAEVAKAVARFS